MAGAALIVTDDKPVAMSGGADAALFAKLALGAMVSPEPMRVAAE